MQKNKKYTYLFIVLSFMGIIFSDAFASTAIEPSHTGNKELHAGIDRAVDLALKENRLVGGVILVAKEGNIIYRRAAGYADRERQVLVCEDTLFRLASVSKVFTSIAAAVLIDQGKLGLDDPVSKWLPYFTPHTKDGAQPAVTVRHLMSHTAGLTYRFSQGKEGSYAKVGISDGLDSTRMTLEENIRRIASVPLLFTPGSSWEYSVATDVLGAVVEKAAKKPLDAAMHELVFAPLGLKNTGFYVELPSLTASAYTNTRKGAVRMKNEELKPLGGGKVMHLSPNRIFDPHQFFSGGAGLAGTANDLFRLLEVIRKNGTPLISAILLKEMNTPQTKIYNFSGRSFGLGWEILLDPEKAKEPGSFGTLSWGGAYGSFWLVDPKNQLTVVIVTNSAFEGLSGKLVKEIRQAVYQMVSKD